MKAFLFLLLSTTAFAVEIPKRLEPINIGHGFSEIGSAGFQKVSLTFDDGPHPRFTEEILETMNLFSEALEANGKKRIVATFFTNGDKFATFKSEDLGARRKYAVELLSTRPSRINIIKEIVDNGHILANHSVHHSNLQLESSTYKNWYVQNEIALSHLAQEAFMPDLNDCSKKWYFRAPFAGWRKGHAANANQNPLIYQYVGPVFWDIGSFIKYYPNTSIPRDAADWECNSKRKSAEFCARGYLNRSYKRGGAMGGIVLMHDIQSITPKMLPYLLRVYTGLNPYPENGELYNKLERFVRRYKFDTVAPLQIVSLNELDQFDQFDPRFDEGGACEQYKRP
jgi:peptidoglycan/xylan/chitin deacetylase (PgdA/CDA1 family)